LLRNGFGPTSKGIAKDLYDRFKEAVVRTKETKFADTPWHLPLDDDRKRKSKCGALAKLRPEPSAKLGVTLETAVIHRNSNDQVLRRKR